MGNVLARLYRERHYQRKWRFFCIQWFVCPGVGEMPYRSQPRSTRYFRFIRDWLASRLLLAILPVVENQRMIA